MHTGWRLIGGGQAGGFGGIHRNWGKPCQPSTRSQPDEIRRLGPAVHIAAARVADRYPGGGHPKYGNFPGLSIRRPVRRKSYGCPPRPAGAQHVPGIDRLKFSRSHQ